MANDFFRTSIPSSVPKHYIAYGNKKKNQTFNALFLIYFSIVNGVEILCEASRGRRSPQGQRGQRCALGRMVGCLPWPWRASSGTLSVVSSSQKTLSSRILWNLVPPEDRAPFACLKDADSVTQDLGDRGRLVRSRLAWWSLAGHRRGLAAGMALAASAPFVFSWLLHPTQGNGICVVPPTADARALEVALWSSVLVSSRYVAGKGHEDGKKKVLQVPAPGPGASTLSFSL